ncbi:MAG TPA: class II aldolase/adducin family protein [Dehalococcoidia bacterium]|nr:class II aldolase/adducin family protein [Dehalococcoidia bacterium]HIN23968.1 class II aldolase/adducin family protein [Dehalococcoidia bacterium]
MNKIGEQLELLVTANRILAREGVVDAYGHVSIRHPERPDRYILSQSRAPDLVELSDLMEYTLEGDPVDQQGRSMYTERPIHGGIYQAREDVMAIVHNHSPTVIPFSVTDTPLRPMFHLGAIIGSELPVWDIRDNFQDTNMLVTNMEQGRDLAACLGGRRVSLMRGHGCVIAGQTIREVVMASVYLQVNAGLLLQSLQLGEVKYLSPGEIEMMSDSQMRLTGQERAWEYWANRAGRG